MTSCPVCGRKMTLLLYSFVCDYCDGVVVDDDKYEATTSPWDLGAWTKPRKVTTSSADYDPWDDDDLIDEDPPSASTRVSFDHLVRRLYPRWPT